MIGRFIHINSVKDKQINTKTQPKKEVKKEEKKPQKEKRS